MAALKCWRLYEVGTNGKGEICLIRAGHVSDVADIRIRVSDGVLMAGRTMVINSRGYGKYTLSNLPFAAAGPVTIDRLLSLDLGTVCHVDGTEPTNEECRLWYEHPEQFSNLMDDG